MKVSPSVLHGFIVKANHVAAQKPIRRKVRGGSVLFCPTAGGAVRIIGLDENGAWIAEFSCLERDYSESFLTRMERHVAMKAGTALELIG